MIFGSLGQIGVGIAGMVGLIALLRQNRFLRVFRDGSLSMADGNGW